MYYLFFLILSSTLFSLFFSPSILMARRMLPDSDLPRVSYLVTREGATETPYENLYWDHHEIGIYVDIISGTPLFSSRDKYDSGTGWPTFSRPIHPRVLIYKPDTSSEETRTEVIARRSSAHLGHLFDDGPIEYAGVRYCMNSAALRFVPVADMKKL